MLVYALESARIERAVNDQIDQEIAEFRELRDRPAHRTSRSTTSGSLLNVFLTRNVPDDDEMLVGYVEGEIHRAHAQPLRPGAPRRAGLPAGRGRLRPRPGAPPSSAPSASARSG